MNSFALEILDKFKDEKFLEGLALPVISNQKMRWTGHSDYRAMKPYIDNTEKTKANAMNLFEMELESRSAIERINVLGTVALWKFLIKIR